LWTLWSSSEIFLAIARMHRWFSDWFRLYLSLHRSQATSLYSQRAKCGSRELLCRYKGQSVLGHFILVYWQRLSWVLRSSRVRISSQPSFAFWHLSWSLFSSDLRNRWDRSRTRSQLFGQVFRLDDQSWMHKRQKLVWHLVHSWGSSRTSRHMRHLRSSFILLTNLSVSCPMF